MFWDIETSPNVVLSWRVGHKINIDSDNILKERAIICIGYKWQHEKHPQVLTWDKNQNDKAMLHDFMAIAADADEMVAHNGDSFDMPWFKTRCLFHGVTCLPDYKTVDTLQWARRKFYFNSNRLNYLAQYLGIGCKIHTEFKLWKAICLDKCKKSLDHMAEYCKQDVALLEKVWKRLSDVVPVKSHAGVLIGGMKWTCPRCTSDRVKVNKTKVTAYGTPRPQMQCLACGGYYTISQTDKEMYLEFKSGKKQTRTTPQPYAGP